jgi:hypothetical protein
MISDAEFNNMTDSRKIMRACRIARVSYPNLIEAQEWMLGLAETAQGLAVEERSGANASWDTTLHELAEREVPHSTYHLWLIWADLHLYIDWP